VSLVLASASASRAGLLRAAGVEFSVHPADLDEAALMAGMAGSQAASVVLALAGAKALTVSAARPGALVLGGDTVIALDGDLVSKCADMAAARALLQRMSGKDHLLVSAAALARDGNVIWRHASPVRLTVRPLSPAFLDAYLAAEGPAILSSVGCYHYEGRGAQLFDRVEGDYFSVLGLPLLPLLAALRQEGVIAR
jgi:septum formation protein